MDIFDEAGVNLSPARPHLHHVTSVSQCPAVSLFPLPSGSTRYESRSRWLKWSVWFVVLFNLDFVCLCYTEPTLQGMPPAPHGCGPPHVVKQREALYLNWQTAQVWHRFRSRGKGFGELRSGFGPFQDPVNACVGILFWHAHLLTTDKFLGPFLGHKFFQTVPPQRPLHAQAFPSVECPFF